ncbi:uncharacterized protein LOC105736411 isoform X2 [Apis florea]|uniref:uncharacterized protein LOC105736411 isoform X2 n=1 Tax=Apis florea TaxID=7463 RepID=UPI0012FEA58F|nr:uncharacterized protein LOC105736411 isoform X2 [Apis florea]
MGGGNMNRDIPSSTLATLRGILVSSLSRENLGPHDLPVQENGRHRPYRKVHFREGEYLIVKGKRVCARASDCFALRYVEREWQGMAELNPYQKLDRVINEFVAFIALDIKHWGGKSG